MNASNTIDLWPLLLYSVIVVVLISGLLVASALLGEKTKGHATQDVYESGVEGVGSAQFRMSVPFYLTAILFIIFDLEAWSPKQWMPRISSVSKWKMSLSMPTSSPVICARAMLRK